MRAPEWRVASASVSNPGSAPSFGSAIASTLNSSPIWSGAGEPRERRIDVGGLLRRRLRLQPRGALLDAEAAQEFALRDRAVRRRALRAAPHARARRNRPAR